MKKHRRYRFWLLPVLLFMGGLQAGTILFLLAREIKIGTIPWPAALSFIFASPSPYNIEQIVLSQLPVMISALALSDFLGFKQAPQVVYSLMRHTSLQHWILGKLGSMFAACLIFTCTYYLGVCVPTLLLTMRSNEMVAVVAILHSIAIYLCVLYMSTILVNLLEIELGYRNGMLAFYAGFVGLCILASITYIHKFAPFYVLNPIVNSFRDWKDPNLSSWIPDLLPAHLVWVYWLFAVCGVFVLFYKTFMLSDLLSIEEA